MCAFAPKTTQRDKGCDSVLNVTKVRIEQINNDKERKTNRNNDDNNSNGVCRGRENINAQQTHWTANKKKIRSSLFFFYFRCCCVTLCLAGSLNTVDCWNLIQFIFLLCACALGSYINSASSRSSRNTSSSPAASQFVFDIVVVVFKKKRKNKVPRIRACSYFIGNTNCVHLRPKFDRIIASKSIAWTAVHWFKPEHKWFEWFLVVIAAVIVSEKSDPKRVLTHSTTQRTYRISTENLYQRKEARKSDIERKPSRRAKNNTKLNVTTDKVQR